MGIPGAEASARPAVPTRPTRDARLCPACVSEPFHYLWTRQQLQPPSRSPWAPGGRAVTRPPAPHRAGLRSPQAQDAQQDPRPGPFAQLSVWAPPLVRGWARPPPSRTLEPTSHSRILLGLLPSRTCAPTPAPCPPAGLLAAAPAQLPTPAPGFLLHSPNSRRGRLSVGAAAQDPGSLLCGPTDVVLDGAAGLTAQGPDAFLLTASPTPSLSVFVQPQA